MIAHDTKNRNGCLWTPSEDAVLAEMFGRNCTSGEIADAIGRTWSAVEERIRKHGPGRGAPSSPQAEACRAAIAKLWHQASAVEIAAVAGVSVSYLGAIAKDAGVGRNRYRAPSKVERVPHPASKLTGHSPATVAWARKTHDPIRPFKYKTAAQKEAAFIVGWLDERASA